MTPSDLRERVATICGGNYIAADAVINAVLEEAAKVAEGMGRVIREDAPQRLIIDGQEVTAPGAKIVDTSGIPEIAAAIRAMKGKP